MKIHTILYPSPLGNLQLSCDHQAITALLFTELEESPAAPDKATLPEVMLSCMAQLDAYFAGTRLTFDLPLSQAGTSFQQSVWKALCDVPYGKTCSYLELARRIGNEKSIRAVGTTNGRNQIGIIIPCHRVIGTNGSLTGYAGGLWRKRWLLEHEQKIKYGIQTLF